jgi:hypothetical protein
LIATPALGIAAAVQAMREEERRSSPFGWAMRLAGSLERRFDPQIILGAIALTLLVHAVETAKFVRGWANYESAVRALATGSASDPDLGDAGFVSSKWIGPGLSQLAWNSTTPYLSVLVAPGLTPTRLVVDPETGYFWLSCETATRSARTSTAIPLQARELIRQYSCLNRP